MADERRRPTTDVRSRRIDRCIGTCRRTRSECTRKARCRVSATRRRRATHQSVRQLVPLWVATAVVAVFYGRFRRATSAQHRERPTAEESAAADDWDGEDDEPRRETRGGHQQPTSEHVHVGH